MACIQQVPIRLYVIPLLHTPDCKPAGNVESGNLEEALSGFKEVLKMEGERDEWCECCISASSAVN